MPKKIGLEHPIAVLQGSISELRAELEKYILRGDGKKLCQKIIKQHKRAIKILEEADDT